VRVDEVRVDAPVRQGGHHLQAQRRGLHDHGALDGVEDLVPLHRGPDVLDVVETLEVGARHAGILVVEAGADDQLVVRHGAGALDLDGAGGRVE